jgi:hypothetical protein
MCVVCERYAGATHATVRQRTVGMYLHLSRCPLVGGRRRLELGQMEAAGEEREQDEDEIGVEREEWGGEPEEREGFVDAGSVGLDDIGEVRERPMQRAGVDNGMVDSHLPTTPRRPLPSMGYNVSPDMRNMPGSFGPNSG